MGSEEIKKLKQTEIEILDYFVDFCNQNNLTYYLTYGTLLGAVRHKGFIPWDDDIDVVMLPEDYQKFLKLYQEKNKNKDYILQYIDNEKYYHTIFAKIRKNNTCMVEKDWQYIKIHKGIDIDIFPLFPYPDNKLDAKIMMFNFKLSQFLVSKNNKTNSIKNKILFGILKLIPRKITNRWASKIINKILNYKGKYSYYRPDDLNCGLQKKEWYNSSTNLTFEKRSYNAPSHYDELLKSMYGDYMQIPKEEDRIGHGDIILSFDKNYEDITKE